MSKLAIVATTLHGAYTVELTDISHLEYWLHDRIPDRGARRDHPLDHSCGNAGRDRL